ncbi:bacterio-opsin activator domain-containing protein [Halomarina litorea]|uniref:helix-turn-helix domain-containing protein n=1 Tax=Halomarina litorea TaxID=2961595 RepID=UPI0020C58ABE|nr:bacterio-opsin activator domain-containing protein [Halomarina sp. BCD28]
MRLELTAPLQALVLDSLKTLPTGSAVEFERMVPVNGAAAVYLAVTGPKKKVVTAAQRSVHVESLRFVEEAGDTSTYRMSWAGTVPPLIASLQETDGAMLSAVATGDSWTLRVRFPSHEAASEFYASSEGGDFGATVRRIISRESTHAAGGNALTTTQRDTLRCALEAGYYEVPRGATLGELAAIQGVSDTATSQRLRRGVGNLLRDTLDER